MDTPTHQCPLCGSVLPAAAGLCPRCLMEAAAGPTEPSVRIEPPSLEQVGAAFPHLEVLGMIGYGGMGAVFKVRQPRLERLAALKLLLRPLAADAAFAARFEREARLLARLSHPNIVAVYDYGQAGGFFYLLMEYVDGVNLREAMQAGRFAPSQALSVVPRICDALEYAHEEGVLHRDIKPENILLDAKGRIKLADFGIARLAHVPEAAASSGTPVGDGLTQAGAALGTPAYMAPEQREAPSRVDHRADIYSLGVVFYELLTGELPGAAYLPPSVRSGADPRVDAIVRQAMDKDRDRRQQSAAEVRTQVEQAAGTQEGSAPAERNSSGRPGRTKAIVAFVCGIALIAVPFIVQNRNAAENAPAPAVPPVIPEWLMGRWVADPEASESVTAAMSGTDGNPDGIRSLKGVLATYAPGMSLTFSPAGVRGEHGVFGSIHLPPEAVRTGEDGVNIDFPAPSPYGKDRAAGPIHTIIRPEGEYLHLLLAPPSGLKPEFVIVMRRSGEPLGSIDAGSRSAPASIPPGWLKGAWTFDEGGTRSRLLSGGNAEADDNSLALADRLGLIDRLTLELMPGLRFEFSDTGLRTCFRSRGGGSVPYGPGFARVGDDSLRLMLGDEPYLIRRSGVSAVLIREKRQAGRPAAEVVLKRTESITTRAGLESVLLQPFLTVHRGLAAGNKAAAAMNVWSQEPDGSARLFPDGRLPRLEAEADWEKLFPGAAARLASLVSGTVGIEWGARPDRRISVQRNAGQPAETGEVYEVNFSWMHDDKKQTVAAEILVSGDLAYWKLPSP